jgi:molybdate transport system substrate-binding protein
VRVPGDRGEKARNAWFEIGVRRRSPIRVRSGEEDMKRYLLSFLIVAAFMAGNSYNARAQSELTLIAPGGARAVLDQLIPEFERKTGYKVKATIGSGLGTKKQVIQGEAFDVPIVQPPLGDVIASGNVVASTETPLASVAVGIAVRKGAPKPDISTPEAVKRLLLAAKSVTYPDAAGGAAAGVSFNETLKKLGIAEQMKSTIKFGQGGAGAMAMVAKGDAEIGLTFLSEMEDPGIDVVGPLPREISTPTSLVGFISAHAKDPAAAKALLDFLSSPSAAAVYKAQRMQPGR